MHVQTLAVACVREVVHLLMVFLCVHGNSFHATACAAYLEPTSQILDLERARAVLRGPVP